MYTPKGWKAIPRRLASDERVLRVGARAFGLYCTLATHTDDGGTLRADPNQLRLMAFGDARLVREGVQKLIEAGLIRRFIARADAKPASYAPAQSEIRLCESPEERAKDIARSPGRSSDGAWASYLWLPDVVVPSLSRSSSVVVTSPFCPRDWLQKAGLADFFEKLAQKIELETEPEPELESDTSSSRSRSDFGRAEIDLVSSSSNNEASAHLKKLLGRFERDDHRNSVRQYLRLFLTESEKLDLQGLSIPDRLTPVIKELDQLADDWTYGSQFVTAIRGAIKFAKGQQHTLDLLKSMLEKQEQREANEF